MSCRSVYLYDHGTGGSRQVKGCAWAIVLAEENPLKDRKRESKYTTFSVESMVFLLQRLCEKYCRDRK
jgi:hypothetical protein